MSTGPKPWNVSSRLIDSAIPTTFQWTWSYAIHMKQSFIVHHRELEGTSCANFYTTGYMRPTGGHWQIRYVPNFNIWAHLPENLLNVCLMLSVQRIIEVCCYLQFLRFRSSEISSQLNPAAQSSEYDSGLNKKFISIPLLNLRGHG